MVLVKHFQNTGKCIEWALGYSTKEFWKKYTISERKKIVSYWYVHVMNLKIKI